MNIEIISSSPRKESITYRLALFLQQQLNDITEHDINIIDVRDWHIGMQQHVFNNVDVTPDNLKPLAERIFKADAFVIVTPEYNGSYSAALKNLLDHFPKQSKKVFGIATASTGALGGMRCTQQLLLYVAALFGIASPHLLVTPFVDKKFDVNGNLLDENFAKATNNFVQEFLWLVEKIKS